MQRRLAAARDEQSSLQELRDRLRGAADTQRVTAQRIQRELQAPQYKDIGLCYNQQYAEVLYTEMANGDLDKYHKVNGF